jgi:hypothetical protein
VSELRIDTAPLGASTARKGSRLFTWFACCALALLALAVRLPGIGHGLPMVVEQDCKIPYQVELLRRGDDAWRSDREFRWYPLFVAHLVKLWPAPRAAPADAPLEQHLVSAAAPQLQARFTVAMLAALMAPAAYLLAALFLERRWALLAGLLCAFSLLSMNFSQQARPHAAAGALFAWTLLALVRLRRRGDSLGRGLAGGALALSIGCLQSGLALLPALFAAELGRRTFQRRWFDPRWLVTLALVALGILFFYPYEFAGAPIAPQPGAEATPVNQGGHLLFLKDFKGQGAITMARAFWSYEPALSVLALVGIVLWLFRARETRADPAESFTRRRDLWVLLAFALPYALVIALYDRTYERFLLPLVPLLACCAAFGVRELARRVRASSGAASGAAGFALWAVAVVLAVAPSAWLCWRLASVRAAPHTTELAARWLEQHAETARSKDIVLTPQLDLPLARESEGFANWMPGGIEKQFTWVWSRYQAALPGGRVYGDRWRLRWWRPRPVLMASSPEQYVAEQGGELLVAEVFADNRVSPAATKLRQWLLANARLVERISPDSRPDYSDHPFGYQEETSVPPGIFFRRLAQARASGPVIEIFELPAR